MGARPATDPHFQYGWKTRECDLKHIASKIGHENNTHLRDRADSTSFFKLLQWSYEKLVVWTILPNYVGITIKHKPIIRIPTEQTE